MRKILLTLSTAFIFTLGACSGQQEQSAEPKHQVIVVPAGVNLMGAFCGDQPCILYYDPDSGSYVMSMVNGSSVTIKSEQNQNDR